jgi:hypothetical protein
MTAQELVERAKSVVGKPIKYNLGCGGMHPTAPSPEGLGANLDCSGFCCWTIGISRYDGDIWFNTDSILNYAKNNLKGFHEIKDPTVGSMVIYPSAKGKRSYGHMGIVTGVEDGKLSRVIHCSAGNYGRFGYAVAETGAAVFNKPETIFVWYEGITEAITEDIKS